MLFYYAFANCKTETRTAFLLRVGCFDLLESLEQKLLELLRNTATAVDDFDLHEACSGINSYCNCLPTRRELDGVREQVDEHLDDSIAIRVDLRSRWQQFQLDTIIGGKCCYRLLRSLEDVVHISVVEHHVELASLEFFNIEDVVDQSDQTDSVTLCDCHHFLCLLRKRSHSAYRQECQ